MSIDVVDLRNFYAMHLGVVARRLIGRGIRRRFADTRGMSVVGVGYPTPYLGLFREEAERCLAFMPPAQGVVKWPTHRPGLAALVDELEMPLPDSSIDRMLLVHALEIAHDPTALLREVWRVLAGGGRLLLIVPNRRGVWGTNGHDTLRPWASIFSLADHPALARGMVHADGMGGSVTRPAGCAGLVLAIGHSMGAGGLDDRGTVCRRAHG